MFLKHHFQNPETAVDLIRLSVGCEGIEDLRDDLEQALAQAD
jgi:cystathionine beta-lyase/cystathionine gamma-synthase